MCNQVEQHTRHYLGVIMCNCECCYIYCISCSNHKIHIVWREAIKVSTCVGLNLAWHLTSWPVGNEDLYICSLAKDHLIYMLYQTTQCLPIPLNNLPITWNSGVYVHIFQWLCAWDICYIIFGHLLHIHINDFVLIIIVQFLMSSNNTFWLADRIRLLVHNTSSSLLLWKLIWRHWTYKMPVGYILSSMRVRLGIFSQLSIIQYMGCVFSVYPSPLWWLRWYILRLIFIIKSEVWIILHRLKVRSSNNGMPCIFLYS